MIHLRVESASRASEIVSRGAAPPRASARLCRVPSSTRRRMAAWQSSESRHASGGAKPTAGGPHGGFYGRMRTDARMLAQGHMGDNFARLHRAAGTAAAWAAPLLLPVPIVTVHNCIVSCGAGRLEPAGDCGGMQLRSLPGADPAFVRSVILNPTHRAALTLTVLCNHRVPCPAF